jgi:hypothetical protein
MAEYQEKIGSLYLLCGGCDSSSLWGVRRKEARLYDKEKDGKKHWRIWRRFDAEDIHDLIDVSKAAVNLGKRYASPWTFLNRSKELTR